MTKTVTSDGQSMVEFALVLPLWLMILALVFMVAWVGYLQISLERAVFEGAKAGALLAENREESAKTRVREVMGAVELQEEPGASVDNAAVPLGTITVTVSYDWAAPFAFGLPENFRLQARAVASLER